MQRRHFLNTVSRCEIGWLSSLWALWNFTKVRWQLYYPPTTLSLALLTSSWVLVETLQLYTPASSLVTPPRLTTVTLWLLSTRATCGRTTLEKYFCHGSKNICVAGVTCRAGGGRGSSGGGGGPARGRGPRPGTTWCQALTTAAPPLRC